MEEILDSFEMDKLDQHGRLRRQTVLARERPIQRPSYYWWQAERAVLRDNSVRAIRTI